MLEVQAGTTGSPERTERAVDALAPQAYEPPAVRWLGTLDGLTEATFAGVGADFGVYS